jgi:hypothetical protein
MVQGVRASYKEKRAAHNITFLCTLRSGAVRRKWAAKSKAMFKRVGNLDEGAFLVGQPMENDANRVAG